MGDAKRMMNKDRYAPLPKHLPRVRNVWNMYGLGGGATRSGSGSRVPPIPALLKPPASYASFTSLGPTSISSEDPRSTTTISKGKAARRSRSDASVGLYTFVPTRTLWPLPREFDHQLDTLENLLLGRNAVLDSSHSAWAKSRSGKEKKRGETTLVLGRHVEVYVGDMAGALQGLDLRRLSKRPVTERFGTIPWFDKRPFEAFRSHETRYVRYLAPARLAVDFVVGSITWPVRQLWAGISALRLEFKRSDDEWIRVERKLRGTLRGGWGWGVVGIGKSGQSSTRLTTNSTGLKLTDRYDTSQRPGHISWRPSSPPDS
jgi:hypothetical protein